MSSNVCIVVVFLISFYSVQAMFDSKILMDHMQSCMKKHEVSEEELEEINKENVAEEKLKCFMTCIGERIGYIKDDEFSEKGALEAVEVMFEKNNTKEKQKAREIIKDCAQKIKEKGDKGCELGPTAGACLKKGVQDHKIMP
uniref:Odorant-binding protein 45 n=1 Tax=Matsumurasca onukii TaxID=2912585 RepID=A0A343WGX9_MATON|nr:odorant-binding protein 45 [Matsumurasca onukii]